MATLLAGCSANQSGGVLASGVEVTEDPTRGLLVADGTSIFHDAGSSDWVSYADAASVVTVVSERMHEIPDDVMARGEGYVARTIEVRVDEVLWQPEHSFAPIAGGDGLEMLVFGWVLETDRLVAMAGRNAPRLEVGGQYVMPVVHFERGWGPMTAESPFPADASAIAVSDAVAWHAQSPARDELAGKSFADMASLLANVAPDPVAARYFHLSPEERVRAVSSAPGPDQ